MIGLEQWRASIGLYHPGSHRQLTRVPGERQLAPILPIYDLVGITLLVLTLAELLVYSILFIIWIRINGYSLLKGGLTRIMASKKRTSGTQLLVSLCAIGLAVSEANSGCLERSVRALAILLIMAGDVEENPGPLPPTSASPESRALRHHFASLVTAIADPLMLSLKLYSTGLIEEVTKDKANLPTMTVKEKNSVLLSAVMSRVDTDPSLFHQFVALLKNDGDDILKSLGGKLEDTYNEFTKGDTERCTLNPPPEKQTELSPSHIGTQPSQPSRPPPPSHSHPPPSQPPPPTSHHPSQPQLSPSNLGTQPSQPPPPPSHTHYPFQVTPPHPNMNPYNFGHFQMHTFPRASQLLSCYPQPSQPPPYHPHTSQPPPYHPHPSQPPPHHLVTRTTSLEGRVPTYDTVSNRCAELARETTHHPHPSQPPPHHPHPSQPLLLCYEGDTEQYTLNLPPAKQPRLSPSHIGTQPSQPPPQPSHSHLQPPQPPPQPSHSHLQPSQPPPQPSHSHHQPSQSHYPSIPPHPNLEPSLSIHPPHSQPPLFHPHPSQPLPHPFPQPYISYAHPSILPYAGLNPYTLPSSIPPQPSQPPHQPSPLHGYNLYHPISSPMHPHIPHLSTTHPPPPPPAQQIQHSPPPPPPQSFLLFVSFLKSFYNSEVPLSYCKWPPVPKKKYINLAAIGREQVSRAELMQFMLATLHGDVDEILEIKAPIKIEDILKTNLGERLHCVLVEGAPGVGKTTLSWEICKRWARGELFQQYSVVMLLRLRDQTVQKAKSIMDLVCYMYANEGFRTNISQQIEQTKGKDTLIILEGLDELPKHLLSICTDQPSIFTSLLSRTMLPDATILVTSRPSATVQLRIGWQISRHIEILGFTEKDIIDYIQNTLSPQELSAFDNYLSTYPNIRLTMYIPLNCAIVVEVYRSCRQSNRPPPKTTTELYTCLVQTILLRYLDSHPDYKDSAIDVDKFTDLPPPVYHHFYELIQMAYYGVQSQQLIFHDQQKTIEHLGFMDAVTELFLTKHSATYSYNFLHLSLQEYLAAYYISLKSIDEQQQLLQKTHSERHLRNTGRFLAGITKYQGMNRATVKAIIEQECKKGRGGELTLSSYTLQLLHESGDYSIIDGYPSYYCRLTDYSPLLDFAVLGHCIANSSYKWTLLLGDIGQEMQSTNRVAMFVQTLNSHSNPSYTIESITCHYDAPECAQHLLLELPQCVLQVLSLHCNHANRRPLPLPVYEHILSKMSRLHTLELRYVPVSTTDAVALAELIKNNNTLRYVVLAGNAIGAEGREALEKITEIKKDLKLYIIQ